MQWREEDRVRVLRWQRVSKAFMHPVPRERKNELSDVQWQGVGAKAWGETLTANHNEHNIQPVSELR